MFIEFDSLYGNMQLYAFGTDEFLMGRNKLFYGTNV